MNRLRSVGLRMALALGLSFALWAFVSFSENPEERLPFEDLPLQVVGRPEDLVVVDQNGLPNPALPPIDVIVETDRATRSELRISDLRAFVDLTGLGAGDHLVPVRVEPTRDISFQTPVIEPPAVPIRLEEVITETVPITVEIQGNVPFSFELGEPEVRVNGEEIDSVLVRGPASRVERAEVARVTANVDQLSASYSSVLQLQPLDESGQVVEGVELTPALVNVRIPITPVVGLKLVPVIGNVSGLPAPGYVVVGIQSTPPLISITGSSGALDAVDFLETAPVDISGATETVSQTVPIEFPRRTSPRFGEPSEATVTVQIQPLSLPFQITLPVRVEVVGNGGLLAQVNPNVIDVSFSGPAGQLTQLDTSDLVATVDMSNRGPGVYRLTPQINLPAESAIRIVGEQPQVTVSLFAQPTSTPAATATAEPSPTSASTPEPTDTTLPPATTTPEPPDSGVPTPVVTPTPDG